MVSFGSGPPLMLIPGLNGRWEWMLPAIRALAQHFRVITLSLCGERDALRPFDESADFDVHLEEVDASLAEANETRVVMCGVSYGGLVALRYAAMRPERVRALVLASTPPPGFEPNAVQERYLRSPRLTAPMFFLMAPRRMGPEIRAAMPVWRDRMMFSATYLGRAARSGMSPTRMAWRMLVTRDVDFADSCRRITMPTLVITGVPGLDRVVPVDQTRRYQQLIAGAELVTLERTGHLGSITRPRRFAEIVARFVDRAGVREPVADSRGERGEMSAR
jgi:3-oxoadipate enol-lactonase